MRIFYLANKSLPIKSASYCPAFVSLVKSKRFPIKLKGAN